MALRRAPAGTLLFFILTFALSWAIWIPLAVAQINVRETPWFYIMVIGGASPSLMGILLIIRHRTYTKRDFVRSFLSLRQIGAKNLMLIVLAIALPAGLSHAIGFLVAGDIPSVQQFAKGLASPLSVVFVLFTLIYSGPLTELQTKGL